MRRRRGRRRRNSSWLLLLLLFVAGYYLFTKTKPKAPGEPEEFANLLEPIVDFQIPVDAKAAVLMDADSGQVLYAKAAHQEVPPASLTKMLTALVAMESRDPKLQVRISSISSRAGGARVGLEPGGVIQLESLVWGMLLRSGNDAAEAVAIGTSGTIDAFALEMNQKANELGATNSHFKNPSGLPTEGHLSTAYDLAVIGRALLANPELARMVQSKEVQVPWGRGKREFKNINRLLREDPDCIGLKTGYTDDAGYCLAAASTKEGKTLIAIVLGCSSSQMRYADASRLLEQGFTNYRYLATGKGKAQYPSNYHAVEAGQTLGQIARKYQTSEQILADANKLSPPYRLEIGQLLVIP